MAAEDTTLGYGKDLVGTSPYLEIMVEGALENVYGGFGGEIGLMLPGHWAARARASYSIESSDDDLEFDDLLLGCDGLKAQAGFDWIYKDHVSIGQEFHKVRKVAESSYSVTWAGFYYNAPNHSISALGLDIMLESTGAFVSGYSVTSPSREWYVVPGYSLYLFPHYRFTYLMNCLVPDILGRPSSTRSSTKLMFSIGPIVCPDLSQFGLASEYYVGMSIGPVDFYAGGIIGCALRNDVPTGDSIDGADDPAGFIDTVYVPYRLALGFSLPISFSPKEAAK
jgi:hypothetical protein